MSAKYKAPPLPKSERHPNQAEKFRNMARELEADDDEKRFDERLEKIAKPGKGGKKS